MKKVTLPISLLFAWSASLSLSHPQLQRKRRWKNVERSLSNGVLSVVVQKWPANRKGSFGPAWANNNSQATPAHHEMHLCARVAASTWRAPHLQFVHRDAPRMPPGFKVEVDKDGWRN
jgi:hypothetical protein